MHFVFIIEALMNTNERCFFSIIVHSIVDFQGKIMNGALFLHLFLITFTGFIIANALYFDAWRYKEDFNVLVGIDGQASDFYKLSICQSIHFIPWKNKHSFKYTWFNKCGVGFSLPIWNQILIFYILQNLLIW